MNSSLENTNLLIKSAVSFGCSQAVVETPNEDWRLIFGLKAHHCPGGTVSVKSDATYTLILRTIFIWIPLSVLLALVF